MSSGKLFGISTENLKTPPLYKPCLMKTTPSHTADRTTQRATAARRVTARAHRMGCLWEERTLLEGSSDAAGCWEGGTRNALVTSYCAVLGRPTVAHTWPLHAWLTTPRPTCTRGCSWRRGSSPRPTPFAPALTVVPVRVCSSDTRTAETSRGPFLYNVPLMASGAYGVITPLCMSPSFRGHCTMTYCSPSELVQLLKTFCSTIEDGNTS